MRQTDRDGVLSDETGRSAERPVFVSSLRQFAGRAGDGARCLALIDGGSVLLSRAVAGVPCRIRLPAAQYLGIGVVNHPGGSVVRLLHRDPGLTVELSAPAEHDEAATACKLLAAALALPVVEPTTVPDGAPLRRRALGHQLRRPRFLKRRRVGGPPRSERLLEREIIARD